MSSIARVTSVQDSLKSDWREVKIGDFARIEHGWPFKSEFFSTELTGKPIVVGIGNFNYSGGFRFESTSMKEYRGEYPEQYLLSPGDILLVMTCQTEGGEILGIPGRIPSGPQRYLHNQRLGKVQFLSDDVWPPFFYWLCLTRDFNQHLVTSGSGTKILHTAPKRIESYRFRLPPLPEQKRIAHILGTLDDKIELNRRMSATLEEMARALFKSWFIDFDPVHAKREGRKPFGMDDATAALFPSEFEDSELGPIPRGWRVGTIADFAEVAGGSTPSTSEAVFWNPPEHRWLTPRDLSGVSTLPLLDTERKVSSAGLAQISSGLLPMGTVLLSSRAPIGYVAIAEVPVAINQGFIAIIPKSGVPSQYLAFWCKESLVEIVSRANGSTFLEISKSSFRSIPMLVPPPELVECYSGFVFSNGRQVAKNARTHTVLTTIRDSIMARIFGDDRGY